MKNFLLLTAFVLGLTSSYAQFSTSEQPIPQKKNWIVGIGGGIGVGSNGYFGISVAPTIGYNLGQGLEGGISAGYQYNGNNYYSSHLLSAGPYVNYSFIPQTFVRAHFAYYLGRQEIKHSHLKQNINEPALWIGGGYQSSGRVRFRAGVMYNVLYKENNSIFSSAIRPFAGVVFAL